MFKLLNACLVLCVHVLYACACTCTCMCFCFFFALSDVPNVRMRWSHHRGLGVVFSPFFNVGNIMSSIIRKKREKKEKEIRNNSTSVVFMK